VLMTLQAVINTERCKGEGEQRKGKKQLEKNDRRHIKSGRGS